MVHSGPHKSFDLRFRHVSWRPRRPQRPTSYILIILMWLIYSSRDILQSWTTVSLQCSLQTTELSTKAHHTHFCAKSNNPSCCSEISLEREEEEFFFDFLRKKFSTEKQIALEIKGNFCLWWWWLLLCQTFAKATPFVVKSWLWHKFSVRYILRIENCELSLQWMIY